VFKGSFDVQKRNHFEDKKTFKGSLEVKKISLFEKVFKQVRRHAK
jgi:hypothetical protein